MFKVLILAYFIGQDPVVTQKTFILHDNFETMLQQCYTRLRKINKTKVNHMILQKKYTNYI